MTATDLARLRQSLGLSQREMAAALGVSVRALQGWEATAGPLRKMVELAVRQLAQRREE